MATYKVQQMAEVWYETEVEADSPEDAVSKSVEDCDLDWIQLHETVEFTDKFYTLNTNARGAEWEEYK